MKNRKIVVVAFMLIAVLLMSVGFAELTDVLTIDGTAKADTTVSATEFEDDVYFSATSIIIDGTGNKAASQIKEGRDDATITADHFTTKGQVVKVKFTIANDSIDFDAMLSLTANIDGNVALENNAEHDPVFTVTWSWAEDTVTGGATTIAASSSKDVWVTITLNETPIEAHSVSFNITYNVEAVEK